MLLPLIRRPERNAEPRSKERGFTMALVAMAMVCIIAMAALSIDIGTLYEAKAEAQRAADAAALTAARVISISGITGSNQTDWGQICGGASSAATQAATGVAQSAQNLISGVAAGTVTVNYGVGSSGATNTDCSGLGANFAVNPVVTVSLQRTNLPVFFARIFSLFGSRSSGTAVSGTATAEVFNPSGSSPMVPVQPRCVKPWMVPNKDPGNPVGCTAATCQPFVSATAGTITHPGISTAGVIGETFNLFVDCGASGRRGGRCALAENPPVANGAGGPNTLDYVPGQVLSPAIAIAANTTIDACSEVNNNDYTKAVAGCDQSTVYACGTAVANTVELTEDPGPPRNDSVHGAQCLINATQSGADQGQDVLAPDTPPTPYTYPFQIEAGGNSALVAAGVVASTSQITNSPSIVSLPIYDSTAALNATGMTKVTVIGFLQVFINSVTGNATTGTINVTVMNVSGCGNAATSTAVNGTSPVPIRLITPP
jgi:Flp pilus assembly protein TadG